MKYYVSPSRGNTKGCEVGNVRAVVGKDANGSMASIVKGSADYYPFGSQFPDRKDLDYRYAYQGQEKDAETGMEAFELRLWDSRIGRWLTPDPYGEFYSPYLGMGNNPIINIDPNGGCIECPESGEFGEIFIDSTGNEWHQMGENGDVFWGTTGPLEFSDYGSGAFTKVDLALNAYGKFLDVASNNLSNVDYSMKGFDLDVHIAKSIQSGVPVANIGNKKIWTKSNYKLEKQLKSIGAGFGSFSKYTGYAGNALGIASMVAGSYEHFNGYSGKSDARFAVDQAFNAMGLSGNLYLEAASVTYNSGYILEEVIEANLQMNADAIHPPYERFNKRTGLSGYPYAEEWVIEWDKLFDGPIGR